MSAKIHLSKKRIVYAICFLIFCLIDQRIKTTSGLDGWGDTFRDLTGAVMAVIILSHYRLKDLKKHKIPYLVWSLVCVIGGAAFLAYGQPLDYFLNDRIVVVMDVFLFGVVLMLTFSKVVWEKARPQLNRRFALVWLVMMLFMIVSRSGLLWPFTYFVMFGCFYLTDFTGEEQEDLFQGMLDGIILAFFLMQGWCFVFRPYDKVRYVGVYSNCNMNALFYLVVLAAVLSRLFCAYRNHAGRWIKLFYWLGSGVVLGFLFLTISRTGWMTAAVMIVTALIFLGLLSNQKNWIKKLFQNGLIIVLCLCLTFPLVFSAVRYLPPMFHHPVWFWGEWSEDKVHSWDKWDSEKFVDIDELLRAAGGRVTRIVKPLFQNQSSVQLSGEDMADAENETTTVEAAEDYEVTPLQQQLYDEMLAAGFAMDPSDKNDAVLVRKSIYKYYFHLLNFRGHPDSEQGFQIFPNQRIGHAHNIYLQCGVDFGIPAMLLFIILIGWSVVGFVKRFAAGGSERTAGSLLFLLVPAVFGLLEYCWGAGSLTITLLFVIWRRMLCDEREQ